jgi:hypothetical protein
MVFYRFTKLSLLENQFSRVVLPTCPEPVKLFNCKCNINRVYLCAVGAVQLSCKEDWILSPSNNILIPPYFNYYHHSLLLLPFISYPQSRSHGTPSFSQLFSLITKLSLPHQTLVIVSTNVVVTALLDLAKSKERYVRTSPISFSSLVMGWRLTVTMTMMMGSQPVGWKWWAATVVTPGPAILFWTSHQFQSKSTPSTISSNSDPQISIDLTQD